MRSYVLSAGWLLLASSAAFAEEPVSDVLSAEVEASVTPVAVPETVLAEVVVTGEKMGRQLQDTTASVAVRSGQSLQDMNDANAYDTLRRTGNAVATENGLFSLRGISATGQGNEFAAPLASVLIDGVAQDRIGLTAGLAGNFDIEQVEVLRGPQSTNLGRNALAGAIIVNNRNPVNYWESALRTTLAGQSAAQFSAMMNTPLTSELAMRLVLEDARQDGFVRNTTRNDSDWAQQQRQSVRLKLGLTPQSADSIQAVLTLQGNTASQGSQQSFEREGATPRTAEDNEASVAQRDSGSVALDVTLPLSKRWHMQSITTGQLTKEIAHSDADLSRNEGGYYDSTANGHQLTQELRWAWQGEKRSRAVLGLYAGYFDQRFGYDLVGDRIDASTVLPASIPGTTNTVIADYTYRFNNLAFNQAIFTEWDHDFGSTLLTLGLRYDREQREQQAPFQVSRADLETCSTTGTKVCLPPLDVKEVLTTQGLIPEAGNTKAKASYDALLPKAAVQYTVLPGLQMFASYAEAYRAGGADVLFSTGQIVTYGPEFTQNYELGWRFKTDDQRWSSAFNVFHVDWRDQQVQVISDDGRDSFTANAASSVVNGAELELSVKPASGLQLMTSLGYAKTAFKEFMQNGEDLRGQAFARSPQLTGSVGVIWRDPTGGWMASGNLSYVDSYVSSVNRDTRTESGDFFLLDGRMGWEAERWSSYVFGRNLLDEDYTTYKVKAAPRNARDASGNIVTYGAPLTLGVELEARF